MLYEIYTCDVCNAVDDVSPIGINLDDIGSLDEGDAKQFCGSEEAALAKGWTLDGEGDVEHVCPRCNGALAPCAVCRDIECTGCEGPMPPNDPSDLWWAA